MTVQAAVCIPFFMGILFLGQIRIGNAVLSSGLLDRLSGVRPPASFCLVCEPAVASLFAEAPLVRRVESFDELVGQPGYDQPRTGGLMGPLAIDTLAEAAETLWQSSYGEVA